MFDLTNKVVMIFGGTGVLFSNVAISLSNNGAHVIIVGRNVKKSLELDNLIKNNKITFIKHNIIDSSIKDLFTFVYDHFAHIDMIINGAGINSSKPFLDITESDINDIFQINFKFVVECCQLYIEKTLNLNKKGKILNIGSVSALNPLSKVFIYSASKAALHNFSKNIAREYGNRGITTNILVPGFFPAEQNKKILNQKRRENILNQTPMKRFGEPTDLCGMVNLLVSDQSEFINGAELVIDGGYSVNKI